MLIDSRSYSSGTGYRYGFNTQEKCDEISGVGNHTTALFWEYDTRLGRRWNVDPILKPFLSSFVVLSNNPIIKIDPDGDDDYFNELGIYLGTDNSKTNNIQIVNDNYLKDSKFFIDANKGIVNNITAVKYSQNFSEFISINYKSGSFTVGRFKALTVFSAVMNKYAKEAGITEEVGVYRSIGNDLGHWDPSNKKIEANILKVKDNKYAITNILVHEKAHKDYKGENSYLSHANIYFTAFKHKSFDKLDENTQIGFIISFADRVMNHIIEGSMGSRSASITLLSDFNKYFNGKFSISIDLTSQDSSMWNYKISTKNGTTKPLFPSKIDKYED